MADDAPPCPSVNTPVIDPAIVVRVALLEAEYLRMGAHAAMASYPDPQSPAIWDLSPFGR
jgi:hypothetical protein